MRPIYKHWLLLLLSACSLSVRLSGAVVATPANVRNVWLEPAFLCAGQTVTAHFEAMRGNGQDLSVLGALSTDNAFSAGDSYFIHDHGASFFYETFAWPISDALTTPGLVTTVWDRVTFNAPVNTANENFLPYSAIFTVPAWMLSGTTYYVLIKVVNSTSNVSGFATASTGLVALPVEASCCKVLVHNIAGYDMQYSLSSTADVVFDQCTPAYTPTPTMAISKSANVTTATLGDTITYSISWINDSSGTVTMKLWDTLWTNLTYLGCDNSCTSSPPLVSWSFSALSNTSGVVNVWVRVNGYPWIPELLQGPKVAIEKNKLEGIFLAGTPLFSP